MKKKVIQMTILILVALVIYLGSIMLGIYITKKSGSEPQKKILTISAEQESALIFWI